MKRVNLIMLITLLTFAFIFALVGTVNATTEPNVEFIDGKEYFFANGTPITIEKRTDGVAGARISWTGGTVYLRSNANVFGGMHNDNAEVNTSITMNGGTLNNVIGGGLHLSKTNSSKIVINGGTVTSVQGGGASSLTKNCGCTNATWYAGDPKNSPCQTNNASVIINGGKILSLVYGGGEGISNTESATVTINNGDLSSAYVTAGGSNGNTTTANLNISGGKLNVVQGVNRGTIDTIHLKIDGGEIKNLYVCGETGDSNVTGTICNMDKSTVEVTGEAKVKKMAMGQNEGCGYDISIVLGPVTLYVDNGTVENQMELFGETDHFIRYMVKIINSENGQISTNQKWAYLKENVIFEVTPSEGYRISSIQVLDSNNKEVEFELNNGKYCTSVPESDITISAQFEKIEEPEGEKESEESKVEDNKTEEENKTEEKDTTPKTGALNIAIYTCIALGTIALIGTVKSKNSKH